MASLVSSTFIPTLQVPLVDGKYHCPDPNCNAAYDQRRGLGSHRKRAHGVTGTSPSVLSLRRKAERQPSLFTSGRFTPKALTGLKTSKAHKSHKPLKPLKAAKASKASLKASLTCDLYIGEGKARHLCGFRANTPAHMGRHRWFTHRIKGTAHASAAERKAVASLDSIETHLTPKRGRPIGSGRQSESESDMLYPCVIPGCTHRPFRTQGRLTNHLNKVHSDVTTDIVHVANPPKGLKHGSNNGNHGFPQDIDAVSRTILPEVYADTVGQIKGWLFALAAQNDIPPQHFASRVIRDLYGTTRRS